MYMEPESTPPKEEFDLLESPAFFALTQIAFTNNKRNNTTFHYRYVMTI